jgi:hypothetical protein
MFATLNVARSQGPAALGTKRHLAVVRCSETSGGA